MSNPLNADQIEKMAYTDFVGLINQWNVPPGAFNTLTSWRVFGNITNKSNILEVACTTGFSSREIALATGARAIGIDLSEVSVKSAIANKDAYAPDSDLHYEAGNGLTYSSEEKFTHIIVGAALRFFPDPDNALAHIVSLIAPGGYLLSTEFYCIKPIPDSLVEDASKIFNITVTQDEYKQVMAMYRDLTLIHEERHDIYEETESELEFYCNSTIERFAQDNPEYELSALDALRRRLLKVKQMSNLLRPYQNYNVLVHKVDTRYYPHRYTELF